ncbi:MAG: DNA translocase FtsK, partial [Phycisphaerales bacterium]|nr:DNA translocase FtsK [Phycisphaerales bacterium]
MATSSRNGRARSPREDASEHPQPSVAKRLFWLVAVIAWFFVAACMVSHSPADPPTSAVAIATGTVNGVPAAEVHIHNWGRVAGAHLSHQIFALLGSGAWIVLVALGAYLAHVAWKGPVNQFAVRLLGIVMIALAFSGFHNLFLPGLTSQPEGAGGLVAIWTVHELSTRFGNLGTALWLLLGMIVGITVAFDRWLIVVPRKAAEVSEAAAPHVATALEGARARAGGFLSGLFARRKLAILSPRPNDVDDDASLQTARAGLMPKRGKPQPVVIDERAAGLGATGTLDLGGVPEPAGEWTADDIAGEDDEPLPDEIRPAAQARAAQPAGDDEADQADGADDEDPSAEAAEASDDQPEAEDDQSAKPLSEEELRAKIARLPVRFASASKQAATDDDLEHLRAQRAQEEEAGKNYVFPGLDLLENPEENYNVELESYVREQATALEGALRTYRIEGEVVGIESGPVITLYQVRLAPGTKVSQITSVASDIARALKAVNIRIVPNTEGLDTVGVEVPNRKKERVRIKELMTRSDVTAKMRLPLFLGKDASGAPLIIDLASLPHMLIAGTTGSGKSVCMNAIIMGFLFTQRPSDLKLVLVDPKMVELSQFKDIPHLMCPVVTDMNKAAAILEWAVTKMDERYELLAEAGCRDISTYNSLTWDELKERLAPENEVEEAKIPRKLPYMVFVIDELADLMLTNKEVETAIVRIAQKARAVGMHLILATQRPQANVVTGLIKSNMPGRLCFKVASGMDSRIVLDQKGGEVLLGQGDMLMLTPRSGQAMRSQGTLVDDQEIRRVVKFVRQVSGPSYERQLVAIKNGLGPGESIPGEVGAPGTAAIADDHEARMRQSAQEDPLFDRAVEIVLESGRGSVSLLQRRLAIGYTRAARLIELMGFAGILGEHKGTVARETIMSIDEWKALKALAARDAADTNLLGPKPPQPAPTA